VAGPYYVDGAVGDDANAGTSEGAGNAWATVDKAMNTVAAGEKVWVKASATYNELATIDTVGGSGNTPIEFEGYTSATGDGGKATIDGQSTRANCIADSLGVVGGYYIFKNFILTGATSHGADLSLNQMTWKNCEFNSNGTTSGHGLNMGNGATCEKCIFSSNSLDGANVGTTSTFLGCRFLSNTQDGVDLEYGSVIHSVFYNNDGNGITFVGANGWTCLVYGCTFDGNAKATGTAIEFPTAFWGPFIAVNNIIYDCTTGMNGTDQGTRLVSRNNLVNSNTTNYATGYQTFEGEVTSAPAFTDEASQDYTLGPTSPALQAGFDGSTTSGDTEKADIGAHESSAAAGGGLLGANKRGNLQ
jgi:hypothetical protein